ncbi:hypothetical protein [Streptomyces sp. NPDC002463]|uniref:hypothetical protein n=1 Tax=Streptomyces sp. NPDC002463 TaxID=3364645 RepID=UPI0036A24CE5
MFTSGSRSRTWTPRSRSERPSPDAALGTKAAYFNDPDGTNPEIIEPTGGFADQAVCRHRRPGRVPSGPGADDLGEAGGLPVDGLAALIRQVLPGLDEQRATEMGVMTFVLAGSLWTHGHPEPDVRAVHDADPTLTSRSRPSRPRSNARSPSS